MTARLTLVAQGATLATRQAAFPADEGLLPSAIPALLPALPAHGAVLLTSPRQAARQTAQALGLTAAVDPLLDDADFGLWSGQSIAEIAAVQPDKLTQWLTDQTFDGHQGESRAALRARAHQWLNDVAAGGRHVIAVTHAAVIRALLCELLNAPDAAFWKIDIAPLTLTDLRHDGRRWTLRRMGQPLSSPDVGFA